MTIQDLASFAKREIAQAVRQPLVLVIDDDDDNLLLMKYALEMFNCVFLGRTDGLDALPLAQTCQPALILLDIVLPQFSGIDLLQQLKQNEQTRHIPTIAVTALARTEDRQELLEAGFDDYISKPFLIDDLEVLVQTYCRRSIQAHQ